MLLGALVAHDDIGRNADGCELTFGLRAVSLSEPALDGPTHGRGGGPRAGEQLAYVSFICGTHASVESGLQKGVFEIAGSLQRLGTSAQLLGRKLCESLSGTHWFRLDMLLIDRDYRRRVPIRSSNSMRI